MARGRQPLLDVSLLRQVPGYGSGLAVGAIYFTGFTGIFLVFSVYLGLASALAASVSGEGFGEFFKSQEFSKSILLLVLAGIGYLMFALAINVVLRVYLVRDLWVRVLESINIHGIEAAANVSARGDLANALGEGFADGLDVAGF